MGAYTWTYIRIDKLTPEQQKTLAAQAKHFAEWSTYGIYMKQSWRAALSDWLNMHNEDYDYYVNECGVSPEKLTKEYLTKKLKHRMKLHKLKIKCYDKCIAGEMTFEEVLRKTHQLKCILGDFRVIKRHNHYYVHIDNEIFRGYFYDENEYYTVEDLIKCCREVNGEHFIDYTKELDDYHAWNDEIETHVREFYEKIGDNNFYVHFG